MASSKYKVVPKSAALPACIIKVELSLWLIVSAACRFLGSNNRDSDLAGRAGLNSLLLQVVLCVTLIQGTPDTFIYYPKPHFPFPTLCPKGPTSRDCVKELPCPVPSGGVQPKVSTCRDRKKGLDWREETEERRLPLRNCYPGVLLQRVKADSAVCLHTFFCLQVLIRVPSPPLSSLGPGPMPRQNITLSCGFFMSSHTLLNSAFIQLSSTSCLLEPWLIQWGYVDNVEKHQIKTGYATGLTEHEWHIWTTRWLMQLEEMWGVRSEMRKWVGPTPWRAFLSC